MLLLTTGAFFSCKKKDGNIAISGQGNSAQLQISTTDTFSVSAFTIREDSLPASGLSYALLGSMSDPLLGKTSASMYAGMVLAEPNSDFPNTLTPDSAILYVPLLDPPLNFYGNTLSKTSLTVRFLAGDIDPSAVYYQDFVPSRVQTSKTEYNGPLYSSSYDSIGFRKDKLELHPGLRIKLSADMAAALMHMPKEAYQSNENLRKYISGFSWEPNDVDQAPGEGGIGVFDFKNVISTGYRAKVLLYYSDTQTFLFTFDGINRTITSGKTGPYPAEVNAQLSNPGKSAGRTFAQSLQGLKTHILFPSLLNLIKGQPNNIAINRVELNIVADNSVNNTQFFPAPRLNLFQPIRKGAIRNSLLPDAVYSTFGGDYNAASGCYKFLLTRYVQDLITTYFKTGEDQNYGVYLSVPTGSPVLAARAALLFNDPRTKLTVTYTKLE